MYQTFIECQKSSFQHLDGLLHQKADMIQPTVLVFDLVCMQRGIDKFTKIKIELRCQVVAQEAHHRLAFSFTW